MRVGLGYPPEATETPILDLQAVLRAGDPPIVLEEEQAREAISLLPERDQAILAGRSTGATYAGLAARLDLSWERVRQLEASALRGLRAILLHRAESVSRGTGKADPVGVVCSPVEEKDRCLFPGCPGKRLSAGVRFCQRDYTRCRVLRQNHAKISPEHLAQLWAAREKLPRGKKSSRTGSTPRNVPTKPTEPKPAEVEVQMPAAGVIPLPAPETIKAPDPMVVTLQDPPPKDPQPEPTSVPDPTPAPPTPEPLPAKPLSELAVGLSLAASLIQQGEAKIVEGTRICQEGHTLIETGRTSLRDLHREIGVALRKLEGATQ